MTKRPNDLVAQWKAIDHAIVRLRTSVMATAFGLLGGTALFVATLWLVILGSIQGAEEVGPTLGLLRFYFPGYEVTVLGSLIGFFYGALFGAIIGYSVALIYNVVADRRSNPPNT